jgi:hypothetical protein
MCRWNTQRLFAGGFVELLDGDAGLEGLPRGGGDLVGAARDMGVVVGLDVEDVRAGPSGAPAYDPVSAA